MSLLKPLESIPIFGRGIKWFDTQMHGSLFQHSVFGAIVFLVVSNTDVYKQVKSIIFDATGYRADGNTMHLIHAVVFAVIMYFGSLFILAPLLTEGVPPGGGQAPGVSAAEQALIDRARQNETDFGALLKTQCCAANLTQEDCDNQSGEYARCRSNNDDNSWGAGGTSRCVVKDRAPADQCSGVFTQETKQSGSTTFHYDQDDHPDGSLATVQMTGSTSDGSVDYDEDVTQGLAATPGAGNYGAVASTANSRQQGVARKVKKKH